MPAVTIRNLTAETHRALKVRAALHNRSTEAEIRAILEAAVRPEGRVGLGTILAEISRKHGVTNEDVDGGFPRRGFRCRGFWQGPSAASRSDPYGIGSRRPEQAGSVR